MYLNSFFDPAFALLPQVALALVRRSRPVMVAPRGELSPGALELKSRKKRLVLFVYRTLGLHRRVLWHASAEREATEIRCALGPHVEVLVRENETELPAEPHVPRERPTGPLRAVFLSRLVPKKGLHVLLEGLARVEGDLSLDVYGTEEDGTYVRRCRALATASGKRVTFHGPVAPDDVRAHLASADVMLFPTASENFGHVIAEALSVSCPVVLPDTTPWSDLVRRGGGAVVQGLNAQAWATEIDAWTRLTPDVLANRRRAAAIAYREWRGADQPPHVFAQARQTFEFTVAPGAATRRG
ncbi:glycosyltransferase [Phycicoccus sp.]|uniref:glycosyltransferase n=1 Tax=Phycicoccus sp. TaxID=1902410 RepID=UPI002C1D2254|nr:glycosyltransferase [Phycicoccus sp.]HMM93617.1 glycosyltransferase [Phycicoccus sp.]